MSTTTRQILVFIGLTILFSMLPMSAIVRQHRLAVGEYFAIYVLVWCPALAALATCWLYRVDLATLGWRFRPFKDEWVAYSLPLLYAFPVYVGAWLLIPNAAAYSAFATGQAAAWGLTDWPAVATWALAIPSLATVGVIRAVANSLGEEIGWRGFLLPRLVARLGFTRGSLVSGVIWGTWHYPLILWADYNSAAPRWFALCCFTSMVISASFITGWLRLKTDSLWPCAVYHASHNLFIQGIFDAMTAQSGPVVYVTGEFGVGMVVTSGLVALCLWTRRGQLQSRTRSSSLTVA